MPRLPGPILRTERLWLALPKPRDVTGCYEGVRNPAVIRGIAWEGPRSRRDLEDLPARAARRQRTGAGLTYVLHPAGTREAIGVCSVHDLEVGVQLRARLGYWLAEPYWGRGLMTEAVAAVLGHAFRDVRVHRIGATVFPDNPASAAVLRKVGFRHEARMRHLLHKAGRYRDVDQYGLLATDAAARRLMLGLAPLHGEGCGS